MALTPEQELARAKEEYEKAKAQAKARYDKIKARHSATARKLDTRRKIVAGGALFELAGRDAEAARVLSRIVEGIKREQDRKAFEGWEMPSSDSDKDRKGGTGSAETRTGYDGSASDSDGGSENRQGLFADRPTGRSDDR